MAKARRGEGEKKRGIYAVGNESVVQRIYTVIVMRKISDLLCFFKGVSSLTRAFMSIPWHDMAHGMAFGSGGHGGLLHQHSFSILVVA